MDMIIFEIKNGDLYAKDSKELDSAFKVKFVGNTFQGEKISVYPQCDLGNSVISLCFTINKGAAGVLYRCHISIESLIKGHTVNQSDILRIIKFEHLIVKLTLSLDV